MGQRIGIDLVLVGISLTVETDLKEGIIPALGTSLRILKVGISLVEIVRTDLDAALVGTILAWGIDLMGIVAAAAFSILKLEDDPFTVITMGLEKLPPFSELSLISQALGSS